MFELPLMKPLAVQRSLTAWMGRLALMHCRRGWQRQMDLDLDAARLRRQGPFKGK